jgi:salicylate 5-hydroxylase small subunit
MMRDRVYALEKANFYLARRWRHVLSPVHLVDPGPTVEAGGRLVTRANFVVHETIGLRPTTVLATGQYRDVVTRDDDGLRFVERLCLNESELVPNSLVFPL